MNVNACRVAALLLISTALPMAAHAAPGAKTSAIVKTVASTVVVKLGKAVQEEYFQTPQGPVLREMIPGTAQSAGKAPAVSVSAK